MLSLNRIVVFLINYHLPTSLLAILNLLKLHCQQVIQLLKVLFHIILLDPQADVDLLLLKLRSNILIKHFDSFVDVTYFGDLGVYLSFTVLELFVGFLGAVVQLGREKSDVLFLVDQLVCYSILEIVV